MDKKCPNKKCKVGQLLIIDWEQGKKYGREDESDWICRQEKFYCEYCGSKLIEVKK